MKILNFQRGLYDRNRNANTIYERTIKDNNLLHVYELYKNTTHEVDDILKKHIELFIKQLKQRPDCNFFIQKWLLHLVSILDSRSETYKKITQMTIQIIGLEIVEQDESFSKNFFENEYLSNKRKELWWKVFI